MKLFVRISNAWRNFFRRRRLSLQNSTDNRVEWYTHISAASILMAFITFVVLMFIVVLTLVGYSSILEVLPGYRTDVNRSRDFMIENILKIDSMERVINDMMLYNDNIALIMDGKSPVVRSSQITDSVTLNKDVVMPNAMDSVLRSQIEGVKEEGSDNADETKVLISNAQSNISLLTPVSGVVTQHFDASQDHLSLVVKVDQEESRVEAIDEGVVIMSMWSPDEGYVVELLHSDDMISIYKNLSSSRVYKGGRVKSGEVLGYSHAEKEFEFELWENGKPIDPENYIIF